MDGQSGGALQFTSKRGEEPKVKAFPSKSIALLPSPGLIFRYVSNRAMTTTLYFSSFAFSVNLL